MVGGNCEEGGMYTLLTIPLIICNKGGLNYNYYNGKDHPNKGLIVVKKHRISITRRH